MAQRIFWIVLFFLLCLRCFFYFSSEKELPDGRVRIRDTIASEPLLFDRSQRIVVKDYLVYLPLTPRVSYGDYVVIEGVAKDGVINNGLIVEQKGSEQPLYVFRNKLLAFYSSVLPTDAAALVSGTVLGSKQLLTSEFWEKLTNTGTAHVVVASGMNVTIISKFLLDLFLFIVPRKKAIPFAFGGVWLYAVLAGFEAPIVRATIMGTITFAAQEMGKLSIALRSFVLTSTVMLIAKPEWLLDTSFHLTFAATLAIMLFSKLIEHKIKLVPSIVKNDFATSLAACLGVAPILWWNFGQFNLFSPFINALLLWTIAPITLVGGLAGIVGMVLPIIGKLLLYLIYPLVLWFLWIVSLFS